MNKLKKFWAENKVLFVLAIILIICVIIFAIVGFTYFYGSSSDVYGNRLDQIKDVPLDNKFLNNVKSEVNKGENVKNTTVKVKGKNVYLDLEFNNGTKMDDAKKVAEDAVKLFSEKELSVYDLQFTIKTNEYTLMGARNSNGIGQVVWNNYTIEEEKVSE